MPEQQCAEIVILPGWGFDGKVFAELAAILAAKYHRKITVLDFQGHGNNCSMQIQAGIDAMIEPLIPRLPEKTILVGWSLGGMAAIRMAGRLPGRVATVVLLASTPCFVKKRNWPHGVDQWQLTRMVEHLQVPGSTQKILRDFSLIVAMGDRSPRITASRLRELLAGNNGDRKRLLHGLQVLGSCDLREDIMQLSCRVVMLLGENDHLVANTTGMATKRLYPSLLLDYIPQTGHAPFVSKSGHTAALLDRYLD